MDFHGVLYLCNGCRFEIGEFRDTMSRPSKFNIDEVLEVFINKCCNVKLTCKELGIDKSTFYKQLKKNPEFRQGIEEAKNYTIEELLPIVIEKARKGDISSIRTVFSRLTTSQNLSLAKDRLKQDALQFDKRLEFDTKVHKDNLEYKKERDKQLLEAELPYVNIKTDDFREMMRERGVDIPNDVNDV